MSLRLPHFPYDLLLEDISLQGLEGFLGRTPGLEFRVSGFIVCCWFLLGYRVKGFRFLSRFRASGSFRANDALFNQWPVLQNPLKVRDHMKGP